MYVVWLSPGGRGGFTGISRVCRDMSWLSSTSGSSRHCCIWGKVVWVVWYNSDVVRVKVQGREIRIGRIQICVRDIIVLVVGINPVTAEWYWPVLVG